MASSAGHGVSASPTLILLCTLALAVVGAGGEPANNPGKGGPDPSPDAKALTLDLGGRVKMDFVFIPAGEFMMGSEVSVLEKPVHRVRISRPFYMGKYEVTQGQWQAVMGNNPSKFKGNDDLPVECVSWIDCQEFCKKLSEKVGRTVRLPTEAEWEYACRAGSTGKFCFGDAESELDDYAWYSKNSDRRTHPVGTRKPNAWGLCDMHGNVWEWCQDWHDAFYYEQSPVMDPKGPTSGSDHLWRGGAWGCFVRYCRSAYRLKGEPTHRCSQLGCRVAVSVGAD